LTTFRDGFAEQPLPSPVTLTACEDVGFDSENSPRLCGAVHHFRLSLQPTQIQTVIFARVVNVRGPATWRLQIVDDLNDALRWEVTGLAEADHNRLRVVDFRVPAAFESQSAGSLSLRLWVNDLLTSVRLFPVVGECGIGAGQGCKTLVATPPKLDLGSLEDSRVRLRSPLSIELHNSRDWWRCDCLVLEEFGFGRFPAEAVRNLMTAIAEQSLIMKKGSIDDRRETWDFFCEVVRGQ
jgi:hypothetical protein